MSNTGVVNESFDTARKTVKQYAKRILQQKLTRQEKVFNETVWEACVLLGVHGTGTMGSFFIFVGLTINFLVQFIFCLLLRKTIKEPFPRESVTGFMRWRLTVGHNWANVD